MDVDALRGELGSSFLPCRALAPMTRCADALRVSDGVDVVWWGMTPRLRGVGDTCVVRPAEDVRCSGEVMWWRVVKDLDRWFLDDIAFEPE